MPLRVARIALFLGLISQAAMPCWSQGNRSSDSELLLSDDAVIVTATKSPQKVSNSPSAVTVIDEETIRLSGATTIPELLELVPGVNVTQANQSDPEVGIRGFNKIFSNKLLVMVDGRSIYQDFYGNIYWSSEPILLSQIKRIEIVRGPGSALYGANAFDGVINIITKTPLEMLDPKAPATIRIAEGQNNSNFSEATGTVGKPNDWALSVGGGYHSTSGYGDDKPGQVADGYHVPIVTLDAQKNTRRGNLLVSAGTTAGADINLTTYGLLASNAGWSNDYTSLTYKEDYGANPLMARFYFDSELEPFFGQTAGTERNRRYDFEIQQQRSPSRLHDLVYGASYRYTSEKYNGTGPYWHNAGLWSLYAQDEYHAGPQTSLFSGVRLDDHTTYGSDVTPRISLVHRLPEEQTLRLSYATAFRAPTTFNTYVDESYPAGGGLTELYVGNPNLKPEKTLNLEGGYRKDFAAGYADLAVYDYWARNLLAFVPLQYAPSPPFPPDVPSAITTMNVGRAHAVGLELESEYRVATGVKALFNYAYEDLHDQNDDEIALSPRNTVNLALQADLPDRWTGYVSVHSVGATFAPNSEGTANLPVGAYTQVDARIGYRFGPAGRPMYFSVGATNILNNGYYEYPSSVTGPDGRPVSARISRTLWVMVDGKL